MSAPAPEVEEGTLQMQITSLDFSSFTGHVAIGRVTRGHIKKICPFHSVYETLVSARIKELMAFEVWAKQKFQRQTLAKLLL